MPKRTGHRIAKPGLCFLQRVRLNNNKKRDLVVTVCAMSGEVILEAWCRCQFSMREGVAWSPMVHCLKVCIQEESGMEMGQFSLMLNGERLQDTLSFCCRHGPRRHQVTLQMVRHDPRHLTVRNFPSSWITIPMSSFLDKIMRLFSKLGEVVAIVDISAQWWQDDDRDGERTLAVEYVDAASGIAAMNFLNGVDCRSETEKRHDDGEPPRKKERFVCVPTGSQVLTESCDCIDRKCRALWLLAWRPGYLQTVLGRTAPPPPPPPPAPRVRATQ
jgi:hypothetical protein